MTELPEYVEGVPNISGQESLIAETVAEGRKQELYRPYSSVDLDSARAVFANALHMHQPLIPAGGDDLQTARLIINLQYMKEHPDIGDNHNAPVFEWCYERMAHFIPQLISEGKTPRIALEYSGVLLHGLRDMGDDFIIESLKSLTNDPGNQPCTEWLGAPWGHAVAPSTPVQDFYFHVRAWQHHFAAIFGLDALKKVRGFSPSEMAIPNEPDVAHAFVKTLKDCGYQWVLVQEHTVEEPETREHPRNPLVPHRLVCTNSRGETESIIAIIKTQGSDTKLVAQMQPFYEAQGMQPQTLGGQQVPALVAQIADGENGGVMMNEFPDKYFEGTREASGSDTPPVNVSEYLEHLAARGLGEEAFPVVQPILQNRIWDRFQPGDGPEKMRQVIETLRQESGDFHMEGGSWTNDMSWVQGYDDVLSVMEEASAMFYRTCVQGGVPSDDPRYRNALYHLLVSQTSCYRYWGQGLFTEYGKEICRRAMAVMKNDFGG